MIKISHYLCNKFSNECRPKIIKKGEKGKKRKERGRFIINEDRPEKENLMIKRLRIMKEGSLMILSSIGECRKAIDYLTEVGEISSTTVMLSGEKHRCVAQPHSELPRYQGHRLILQGDNTLVCSDCGRKFYKCRQELTKPERRLYESLSPTVRF